MCCDAYGGYQKVAVEEVPRPDLCRAAEIRAETAGVGSASNKTRPRPQMTRKRRVAEMTDGRIKIPLKRNAGTSNDVDVL